MAYVLKIIIFDNRTERVLEAFVKEYTLLKM